MDHRQPIHIPYGIYVFLTSALLPVLVPALWLYSLVTGHFHSHFGERLGVLPPRLRDSLRGNPRIWIHAASLGEVRVAASLIEALKQLVPTASIVVSTVTDHGRNLAAQLLGDSMPVISAPFDFVFCVRKALSSVRPHTMVFLETELWPAWICEAHRLGITTVLVNGRISERSLKRYLKLKGLFREVLRSMDGLSMIGEEHANRIIAMGANPQRVTIHGNAKYDMLGDLPDSTTETRMREVFNIRPNQRVLIAGSTRRGEEAMVLDAYEQILTQFPDTILILAPRHIDRTRKVAALLRRRGFRYQLRSHLGGDKARRMEQVVLLNSFGELSNLYSVGSIVFCGASLVPLGGQNPLEPAAWGKTVLYGPHMENFVDARAILEGADAGFEIASPEELANKAIWFLGHPEEMEIIGRRAREAAGTNQGAAKRQGEFILGLVRGKAKRRWKHNGHSAVP